MTVSHSQSANQPVNNQTSIPVFSLNILLHLLIISLNYPPTAERDHTLPGRRSRLRGR